MNQEVIRSTPKSQPKTRDGVPRHQDSGAKSQKSNLAKQLDPADKLLPHERDQGPDADEVQPDARERIKQAQADVMGGLRDTERRGTPSDVPVGTSRKPSGANKGQDRIAEKRPDNAEHDDTGMAPPESEVDMSDRPPGSRR